jgi:hypothetical protein
MKAGKIENSARHLTFLATTEWDEQNSVWLTIHALQLFLYYLAVYDSRFRGDPNYCYKVPAQDHSLPEVTL